MAMLPLTTIAAKKSQSVPIFPMQCDIAFILECGRAIRDASAGGCAVTVGRSLGIISPDRWHVAAPKFAEMEELQCVKLGQGVNPPAPENIFENSGSSVGYAIAITDRLKTRTRPKRNMQNLPQIDPVSISNPALRGGAKI